MNLTIITSVNIEKPFIDLRAILALLQNLSSNFGLFFNAVLLYLIFFKTTKILQDYKVILIQNCFVDTYFTSVNDLVGFQTEYKNGWFIMFIFGKAGTAPFPYTFIFMCLWVASLLLCTTFIPVQFVYRHYMIVKNRKMTKFEYLFCCGLATFGALSYASSCVPVFWPSEEKYTATLPMIKSDSYYYAGIPVYYAAHISNWPLRLHFIYAMFSVQLCYGITILACISVWRHLNNNASDDTVFLSPQTRKMHKQMTKTIILQAICPFFCVMLPTGVTVIVTFFQLDIPGLGIIITSSWYCISISNPLVTIFSIKVYRQVIFKAVKKVLAFLNIKKQWNNRISSVTNASSAIKESSVKDLPKQGSP